MSLISYTELCELVEQGVITGVEPESINATSIDVHLAPLLIAEAYPETGRCTVDLAKRTQWASVEIKMNQWGYTLAPNEFVLASTIETFNLPNDISAEFRLKSSGARSGLNNLFACHCDPGWHGSALTLELHNVRRFGGIKLTPGVPIGQMLFHRVTPVPEGRGYKARGRYNNDAQVQGVKL